MVCTDMWFVEFSKWCRNGRNSVALVDILIKFFESRVVGFSPAYCPGSPQYFQGDISVVL